VKPEMSKEASEVSLTNVGFLSATELTFPFSVVPLSFGRPLKKREEKNRMSGVHNGRNGFHT